MQNPFTRSAFQVWRGWQKSSSLVRSLLLPLIYHPVVKCENLRKGIVLWKANSYFWLEKAFSRMEKRDQKNNL